MTTTDARDIAVDTLTATKAVIDHMCDLHAQQHREIDAPNGGYVSNETSVRRSLGEAHDKVRWGLKFAEINALVAISDRLSEITVILAEKAEPARLGEVARMVAEYNEQVRP